MRLTTTDDKKMTTIKALLYGDWGIGKTKSISTLPVATTTILHTERSTAILRKYKFNLIPLESWTDVRQILVWVKDPESCEDEKIRTVLQSTKNLFIDSLSEVADLCIRHIVGVDRKALIMEREDNTRDTPKNAYADMMTWEDWGLFGERILNMTSAFCHLPINVIMTCLAGYSTDKKGNEVRRIPDLPGKKAPKQIGRFFDLVFSMEAIKNDAGEDVRMWRTQPSEEVVAKGMPELDTFEKPNWTTVLNKIFNSREKKV